MIDEILIKQKFNNMGLISGHLGEPWFTPSRKHTVSIFRVGGKCLGIQINPAPVWARGVWSLENAVIRIQQLIQEEIDSN